ncbi:MAG: M48 family metallopeptidase [Proteobacteria bacterium]|nr:M48 family metallopeptidase [Pseudomonadota bacterium]
MALTTGEIIDIDDIGPVLFVRSLRARRMNVSIRPIKGVRVAIPRSHSLEDALCFVRSRTGWINEQISIINSARERHRDLLDCHPKLSAEETALLLTTRIRELSKLHALPFNRLYLKDYKSRWGSCSVRNDIGLNIKLARLPDELVDYIMLHELTHIRWRGHGKRFWTMLERLNPGARELDGRMKDYLLEFL